MEVVLVEYNQDLLLIHRLLVEQQVQLTQVVVEVQVLKELIILLHLVKMVVQELS